jgi:hypothetical protein
MDEKAREMWFAVTVTLHQTSHSEDTLLHPFEKFQAFKDIYYS